MVSLYNGNAATTPTVLKDGNSKAATTPKSKTQQPSTSNKRKAQDDPPAEDNKENIDPPATPPHAQSKVSEPAQHEQTPGRVGPIKCERHTLSPDIKPFKGPPGKKVRKTRYEKNEEYKQFIRENEDHCFHDLYVCFDKGPNGSPTYDKSGFQLDYHKVADWMKPRAYNKTSMLRNMDRSLEKSARDAKRMAEIFFVKGEAPSKPEYSMAVDYWKDRVSKDLNVPWHKIEVEHFEEWEKRGFKKARAGEYRYETFSEEERKRMLRLMSGASLRK